MTRVSADLYYYYSGQICLSRPLRGAKWPKFRGYSDFFQPALYLLHIIYTFTIKYSKINTFRLVTTCNKPVFYPLFFLLCYNLLQFVTWCHLYVVVTNCNRFPYPKKFVTSETLTSRAFQKFCNKLTPYLAGCTNSSHFLNSIL